MRFEAGAVLPSAGTGLGTKPTLQTDLLAISFLVTMTVRVVYAGALGRGGDSWFH